MDSIPPSIESFLGWVLSNQKGRDAKLFTKSPAFSSLPQPNITITSSDCGASGTNLPLTHGATNIGGKDLFPSLSWSPPVGQESSVKEYVLISEDPDAPLPSPIFHGIYYGIPATKTSVEPEDFQKVGRAGNELKGGFKYGKNRRGTVYMGPRPVMGHGPHRYFYSVVALNESIGDKEGGWDGEGLKQAVRGKVVGWGEWVGVYERKSS